MENKKVFLKWSMIKRDVLRHWPIWAFSFVVYLFVVCLVNAVSMNYISTATNTEISMGITASLIETTTFLAFMMGFAAAWASFGFLCKKKKDFFFEALPFNRVSLYVNKYIFGYIMCILPCIVIFFIELLQILLMSCSFEAVMLLKWLASAFIEYLFWYSFAILFFVLCGRVLMAGTCYLMFSFLGLYLKFFLEISNLICFIGVNNGFGSGNSLLGFLSPVEYIYQIGPDYHFGYNDDTGEIYNIFIEGSTEKLIVTLIVGIIIAFAAYILFSKRKEERTDDNVVFIGMKYIFSCVISFTGTITLSLVLYTMIFYQNDEIAHSSAERIKLIAIMVIIGFVIYLISCMIVEKKLKVFRSHSLKALIFTIAVAFIGIGYLHDIFNIEGYVPNLDDIKEINMSYNDYLFKGLYELNEKGRMVSISDKESFELISDMHKIVLNNLEEAGKTYDQGEYNDYCAFSFSYKLKNETSISRYYTIYRGSNLDREMKGYIENYISSLDTTKEKLPQGID